MVGDNDDQNFSNSTQIEVYRNRQLVLTIETDAPIREWHFWKEGKQLSVQVGKRADRGAEELFNLTGRTRTSRLDSVSPVSELPQWAKGCAELEDESVANGPRCSELRTRWIAKVLRQIEVIAPGMTPGDLYNRRWDLDKGTTNLSPRGGARASRSRLFSLRQIHPRPRTEL
jgi:hypothetical protein